jgi:hypothetical protein
VSVAAPSSTRRRPTPRRRLGEAAHAERSLGGGGLTLERKLQSVWEGLSATGAASCPLCDGEMEAAADGGTCGDCGTQLL